MKAKLKYVNGDGLTLTLPWTVLKQLGWAEGTIVSMDVPMLYEGTLHITKKAG